MAYPHKRSTISYKSSVGQWKHIGQRPMLYRWTTPPTLTMTITKNIAESNGNRILKVGWDMETSWVTVKWQFVPPCMSDSVYLCHLVCLILCICATLYVGFSVFVPPCMSHSVYLCHLVCLILCICATLYVWFCVCLTNLAFLCHLFVTGAPHRSYCICCYFIFFSAHAVN